MIFLEAGQMRLLHQKRTDKTRRHFGRFFNDLAKTATLPPLPAGKRTDKLVMRNYSMSR
jgi:hypothetical protein